MGQDVAGYTLWALAQQLLLPGYFLARLLRIIPRANLAAFITAVVGSWVMYRPGPQAERRGLSNGFGSSSARESE